MKYLTPCLLFLALASPALAAPQVETLPERAPVEELRGPLDRTFISPAGQPFRPSAGAVDPFDAWFAQADANHDGRIDRAEFQADADAFLKVLDANADGRVDGFETNAYERTIAPEIAASAERGIGRDFQPGRGISETSDSRRGERGVRPPRGGPRGERPGRGYLALLNEPEPVSGADADFDSRITAAEWRHATDRRFGMIDSARLGYLTRGALVARLPKPPKPPKRR